MQKKMFLSHNLDLGLSLDYKQHYIQHKLNFSYLMNFISKDTCFNMTD